MLINTIILNASGYLKVEIEGFFIQRFINLCISKGIFLDQTKHVNKTKIITKISKNDFRDICKIAKKTNCRIKIVKKAGIPFIVHKYRKRKIFLALFCVLGIMCLAITRFVWNIEINGLNSIKEEDIIYILKEHGIEVGTKISKIKTENLINEIRLKREDIAWVGAKVEGTNFIVNIVEAEAKPEIVDNQQINNIVSNKSGIITRINVQSGTARVNIGDQVNEETLLVEGVMEGKYTGKRYVNSRADIYAKITYSKSETRKLNVEEAKLTGNEHIQYKINLNNFKINLNKGVSNFENYDTIVANKNIKVFSNYYLPIQLEKITYKEKIFEEKQYTVEEITNELKTKLEKEILNTLNNQYEELIESTSAVEINNNEVTVIVNCVVEEKIGITKDLVF